LLGGARIGKVANGPRLVSEGNGVLVPLKIYDYIKIPDTSKFTVGSSGLLGDRFVSVTMPAGTPTKFLAPNSLISGARETGIDDLTREGGALVGDLRGVVQKIDTTVTRLNDEVLSKETAENLRSSVAHLNDATSAFAESAKKFGPVVDKADSAMDSTKKAADDLQKVLSSATQGKGLLAALLTNQELANDLRALVGNLRAHGVLFYRDSAAKMESGAREQTKPSRNQSGAR
jgi:phospholipid/cholesterol/gamma-HCH transport system substrate-binding protein